MDIIELFIEDGDDPIGIEAISVVENPAIEEDFIALKDHQVKFAEIDAEKKILLGAALIPNKPIYRKNGEDEYYIYFSKKTVRKASELFFINGNQNNSTLEHEIPLTGLSAVESWIIEDEVQDKSRKYGLSLPVGTWMVSMKVNNDEIWNDYVKTGKVKGFSIEGYFADKLERPKDKVKDDLSKKDKMIGTKMSKEEKAQEVIDELKQLFSTEKVELSLINNLMKQFGSLQTLGLESDMLDIANKLEKRIPDYKELKNKFDDLAEKAKELGVDKMVNDAKKFSKACTDKIKKIQKQSSSLKSLI